jgi:hypothetical protein
MTATYRFKLHSNGNLIDRKKPGNSYRCLFLWDTAKGKAKTMLAHRLVWMLHNRKRIPKDILINHINGIKFHNNPDNLELSTHSENNAHAFALGLNVPNDVSGDKNGRALFSDAKVGKIRKYFAQHAVTVKFMSEKFGTSWMTMKLILNCQNYRYVKSGYEKLCKAKF